MEIRLQRGAIENHLIGCLERRFQHRWGSALSRIVNAPDDFGGDRACDFARGVPAHAVGDKSETSQFPFGTSFRRSDESDRVLIGRANAPNVGAHGADHAQSLRLALTFRDRHTD
jgi:hypothetical protein